ncbi:MAG: DMT family transporter [Planctomycetaceae bacterium]|nr:DMT family transporter [Planctomycetaceae bacterium]
MLLLMCFFWGTTFPLMKGAVAEIERIAPEHKDAAPVIFLTIRYAVASLCVLALLLVDRKLISKLNRRVVGYATLLGLLFLVSMFLQVYGLRLVTPALSAFLTSMMTIFVPIIMWVVFRKPPPLRVFLAALIAVAGAVLIGLGTGGDGEQATQLETSDMILGSVLTLGCAFVFGFFVIYTNYTTIREDPNAITLLLVPISCVGGIVSLCVIGDPSGIVAHIPDFFANGEIMRAVVITAVFATALATYTWNRWQREISPSRAAILYTTEPIFATIVSVFLGDDQFTLWLLAGAACVIAANLWCELGGKKAAPPAAPEGSSARQPVQAGIPAENKL